MAITNYSQGVAWLKQNVGTVDIPFLDWISQWLGYRAYYSNPDYLSVANVAGDFYNLAYFFGAPPEVAQAGSSVLTQPQVLALENSYCANHADYVSCAWRSQRPYQSVADPNSYANYVLMVQRYLGIAPAYTGSNPGNPVLAPGTNVLNTVVPLPTWITQAPQTNVLNPPNGTQQTPTYQQIVGGQTGGSATPAFVTQATSWISDNLGLVAAGVAALVILPMVMGGKR